MKALDLLPDGTFTIRDGTRAWGTRRPTIGEWRSIFEATEMIDGAAQAINAMPSDSPDALIAKATARKDFRRGGQWASAVAYALSTLGPEPVTVEDLPTWCAQASVIIAILEHWEEVPLDLSPVTAKNGTSSGAPELEPLSSPL